MKDLGHAGVWKGIPGSLSEQGRPGLPLLSHLAALNEGSTPGLCTVSNFFLV